MTRSHGRTLGGVLSAAVLLLGGGAALFAFGLGGSRDAGRVLGVLAVVVGLACLRVLSWVRRGRVLTDVGLSLRQTNTPGGLPKPPDRDEDRGRP